MESALTDFLHYCRVERRLAPLTRSAYERDVTECMRAPSRVGLRGGCAIAPRPQHRSPAVDKRMCSAD